MRRNRGPRTWIRKALTMGAVLASLLTGCHHASDAVRDLPELPQEFARNLAPARTAPVLVTRPAAPPIKIEPISPGGPIYALKSACTSYWDGYVVYPIAVCYPRTDYYKAMILSTAAAAPVIGKQVVMPVQFFKLSSGPGVRSGYPWFCSVRGGPWYAQVRGAQICDTDPNIRSFRAEILGAPESVVEVWSGTLNDVPPPLILFGITQSSPDTCTCCSGTTCPNGSCVPPGHSCGGGGQGPPA